MHAGAGQNSGTQQQRPAPVSAGGTQPGHLPRDPRATQTVDELRHSELMAIHRSLGRLFGIGRRWWSFHLEWHKIFGAAAVLFLGCAIGGGVALIPFLAADPSHVAKREYIELLAFTAAIGVLCLIARFAVRQQQVESIRSV